MAYIAATLTNLTIAVHGKKGAKQVSLEEFMPNWTGEEVQKPPQTVEDMKEVFKAIVQSSKQVKRRDDILQQKQKRPPTKLLKSAIHAEQTRQKNKENG